MEIVPAEGLPDDELAVYTLTHGERACASLWKRLESRMRTGAFRCISSSTAAEMRRLSLITMRDDAETNTITVETEDVNGDFAILFHPALVDVSRPVTVRAGDAVCTVQVNPSEEFLEASIRENGDPELACVGRIMYSEIVSPAR